MFYLTDKPVPEFTEAEKATIHSLHSEMDFNYITNNQQPVYRHPEVITPNVITHFTNFGYTVTKVDPDGYYAIEHKETA